MKDPKYHIYLTNEERSEVLKSLIDLKNEKRLSIHTQMILLSVAAESVAQAEQAEVTHRATPPL